MMGDNINYDFITRFLRGLLPSRRGKQKELEELSKEKNIPIISPEVVRFLQTLISSTTAKNILEVGTAIGYSAIAMQSASGGKVTTIEKDHAHAAEARKNVKDLNIEVLEGDAMEILPTLTGPYDFIFLDAAKAHYSDFLPHCLKIISNGGILASDNVLYKGMVATDDLRERRQITIIKRMRKYLEEITNHPNLMTSIVPMGDGLAISVYSEKPRPNTSK